VKLDITAWRDPVLEYAPRELIGNAEGRFSPSRADERLLWSTKVHVRVWPRTLARMTAIKHVRKSATRPKAGTT